MNAPLDHLRLAASKHVEWRPEPYQSRAVAHLVARTVAGLALDPGLGKTAITLAAFSILKAQGRARTMLVIAPLRVCRHVWRQEGEKWSQFRDLRFTFLHGSKKEEMLRAGLKGGADVFLINPEGVRWLCNIFFGKQLPFDVVCIDELTRFKNAQSDRSMALRPRTVRTPYRWGLTGSLAPNGYMDLFGQQLMLDGGAALGRFITHYRDRYFQVGYDGFTYELLAGSSKAITERIAPTWLRMSAEDYLTLPPLVERKYDLVLGKSERALYMRMKNDMVTALPGGTLTAANMAACYAKLAQMANGAVYHSDKHVEHIHDVKLDALDEIVEELAGSPLLVGYEFQHDLDRLKVWHEKRFGKPLAYLGQGQSEKREEEVLRQWNAGTLPVLAAHPASAGHGLNMQEASAAHLAWFGITWDFELYDQFIRRIRRRGNQAQRIIMHLLIVHGTIDEMKWDALQGKDTTQQALFRALNGILGTTAEGGQEKDMVAKLSTRGGSAGQPPQNGQGAPQTAGGGWGGGHGQQAAQGGQASAQSGWGGQQQREAVQEAIQPRESVRGAFSNEVQAATDAIQHGDYGQTQAQAGGAWGTGQTAAQVHPQQERAPAGAQGESFFPASGQAGGWGGGGTANAASAPAEDKPKRTRTRKAADTPADADDGVNAVNVRLAILLEVVKSSPDAEVADIVEITDELATYVLNGKS